MPGKRGKPPESVTILRHSFYRHSFCRHMARSFRCHRQLCRFTAVPLSQFGRVFSCSHAVCYPAILFYYG